MRIYRIGDRVVVRPDLREGFQYYMADKSDYNSATSDMCKMAGKSVIITEYSASQYRVEGSPWHWTDDMFSGLEDDLFDKEFNSANAPELSALFE